MKKFNFLVLLAVLLSCREESTITSIVIKNDRSNTIDLFAGRYTVHHMDGKDIHYDFAIDSSEKEKIKQSYFKDDIKSMQDTLIVRDSRILIMPSSKTLYIISFSNGRQQEIFIEEDSKTDPLNLKKYKRLRNFINQTKSVIDGKYEIRNAPKSDIVYM